VGSSAIQRFLARHGKIGLDTSILIYQVEGHPKYEELTGTIFAWLESPDGRAVTSTVTMLELLSSPTAFQTSTGLISSTRGCQEYVLRSFQDRARAGGRGHTFFGNPVG
jgi:predicted nucleic acid-binding protein